MRSMGKGLVYCDEYLTIAKSTFAVCGILPDWQHQNMERQDLEHFLLTLKGAGSSYPFGPDVLVFKVMGKMFALTSAHEGVPNVTLKCIPFDGEILAEQFEAIAPGYHMNKRHWITISLTGEISAAMLQDLASKSYELVVKKLTKAQKLELAKQT